MELKDVKIGHLYVIKKDFKTGYLNACRGDVVEATEIHEYGTIDAFGKPGNKTYAYVHFKFKTATKQKDHLFKDWAIKPEYLETLTDFHNERKLAVQVYEKKMAEKAKQAKMLKPVPKRKHKKNLPAIMIYYGKKVTVAVDTASHKKGVAKCSPEDKFNRYTGAFVAMSRLAMKTGDVPAGCSITLECGVKTEE